MSQLSIEDSCFDESLEVLTAQMLYKGTWSVEPAPQDAIATVRASVKRGGVPRTHNFSLCNGSHSMVVAVTHNAIWDTQTTMQAFTNHVCALIGEI